MNLGRVLFSWTSIGLALSSACGGAPAPEPATARPVEVAEVVVTEPPPEEEAVAPPAARLEVPAPSDLAAAIAARLPTIEIVPQSCEHTGRAVAITDERVCLVDPASGLSRAMRRFATSDARAISAARVGDDVIFAVVDTDVITTRYAQHLWRWSLDDDSYRGLAAISEDDAYNTPQIDATDFGVLIRDADEETVRVFVDGELRRLRPIDEPFQSTHLVDGHTYAFGWGRNRESLVSVRLDGTRVVTENVASYPVARHLPLLLRFPDGRPLVVSAFPRRGTTTVYVVRPPATEVQELTVAVDRPREARMIGEALGLRTGDATFLVDLSTGAVSPGEPWPETVAPSMRDPRSVYALLPDGDGLVLAVGTGRFRLGPEGVAPFEGEVPARRRTCRCDGEALTCGETRIEQACTDVAELERIEAPDEGDDVAAPQPPSVYTAAHRIDRLEPDLMRVTRLADGARIWVRVIGDGVWAQADDGAFAAPEGASLEGFALRWGRSLLDAPVTPLAASREAFLRPTLVADFFAGRPLPAADTTLPSAP